MKHDFKADYLENPLGYDNKFCGFRYKISLSLISYATIVRNSKSISRKTGRDTILPKNFFSK